MESECITDSSCCYTDDSGAGTLMIVCFCLASTLLLMSVALMWLLLTSISGRCSRAGKIGHGRKDQTVHGDEGSSHPSNPIGFSGDTGISDKGPTRRASATTRSGSPDCEEALSLQNMEKGNPAPVKRMRSTNASAVGAQSVGMDANKNDDNANSNAYGNGNARDDRTAARSVTRDTESKSLRDLDDALKPDLIRRNSWSALVPPSPGSSVGPDTVHRLRVLLNTERSRRMAAESVLGRRTESTSAEKQSFRTSLRRFPGPQAIEAHALEASANAARWAQSATALAGHSQPELPGLICRLLSEVFTTCDAEVKTRLAARVEGLKAFVCEEHVALGLSDGTMAGDTQDLLYSELRKRFQSIPFIGRAKLVNMSRAVLTRALTTEDQKEIARKLLNQTWPTFEPVIKSYLALFVECALQRPAVEFEATIGNEEPFDATQHRELARFLEPEGNIVFVVFPALKASRMWRYEDGSRSDVLRDGVITWSTSNYFRL